MLLPTFDLTGRRWCAGGSAKAGDPRLDCGPPRCWPWQPWHFAPACWIFAGALERGAEPRTVFLPIRVEVRSELHRPVHFAACASARRICPFGCKRAGGGGRGERERGPSQNDRNDCMLELLARERWKSE